MTRKIEATIDLGHLRHNIARVRALSPRSRLLAMVKADAYGHGARGVLPALGDADALAVAHIDEALELREYTTQELVILEGFLDASEWQACLRHRLTPVVHQREQLALLEREPPPAGAAAWIKIDTGMHRLGFAPAELEAVCTRLRAAQPALRLVLMTHLAGAEEPAREGTERQIAAFDHANAALGLPASIANSAGILGWPSAHRDWVRPGLMLYGIAPAANQVDLRTVMTLRSRVIALRSVEAGDAVGYNGRWRAQHPTRIATISAGYADGYPAQLPDGTPVRINGAEAPLAGRPSMDMITVDVGHLPTVKIGDEAILWGDELPVAGIARRAGMLVYELLTGVSKRVPRRTIGS